MGSNYETGSGDASSAYFEGPELTAEIIDSILTGRMKNCCKVDINSAVINGLERNGDQRLEDAKNLVESLMNDPI